MNSLVEQVREVVSTRESSNNIQEYQQATNWFNTLVASGKIEPRGNTLLNEHQYYSIGNTSNS